MNVSDTPPAPADVTVLLLAAVDIELEPIIRRLNLKRNGTAWHGLIANTSIVAALTGIGGDRAVNALAQHIAAHPPAHIINFGFAGGLDPALRIGDVLDVHTVVNARGESICVGDHNGTGPRLLTADTVVDTVERKQALWREHGAAAVDMESFALARAATEQGLALTLLRAISDDAATALPAASAQWVTPEGRTDKAAAMKYLARRPWQVRTLMALQKNAQIAGAALADAVEQRLTHGTVRQ